MLPTPRTGGAARRARARPGGMHPAPAAAPRAPEFVARQIECAATAPTVVGMTRETEDQPDGEAADHSGLDERDTRRRAAIESASGALTGTFPPGYLEEVRQDWPD